MRYNNFNGGCSMLFTRQTIRIKPSTTSSCLNRFTSAKLEIATGSHKCHIKSCCLHTVQVRYITARRYLFIHRPLVETSSRWGGPCIKSLDPTILENPCWTLKGWLFHHPQRGYTEVSDRCFDDFCSFFPNHHPHSHTFHQPPVL